MADTTGRTKISASTSLNKTMVLIIILASYVMIVLDISIVLTGLPKIRQDLGFSDAELSWVQNAYTLTFGGFMLLGARAGDVLGPKRILNVGLVIFTLSSVAVGAAQSAGFMVAARAVQGIGAAILAPSTLALLQTTFAEGPERERAISYYSAMSGISASVGLVLGGVLADILSWRVGFYINLPIGGGVLLLSWLYIGEQKRQPARFDIAGALTSTTGMSLLVYALIRSATEGWSDVVTLAMLALSILLLWAFVLIERRATQPIMPLHLFNSAKRSAAYACRVLVISAMIGFFFFTPQLLQDVLGFRPAMAGLAFLPTTLVNFATAMTFQRIAARIGSSRLLIVGLISSLIGVLWLSFTSEGSNYLTAVAMPMVLIGLGQGLMFTPLTSAGVADVAEEDAGAASGVVSVAHQIGNSLGLAVLVAFSALATSGMNEGGGLSAQISVALVGSAILLGVALTLASIFIVRRVET